MPPLKPEKAKWMSDKLLLQIALLGSLLASKESATLAIQIQDQDRKRITRIDRHKKQLLRYPDKMLTNLCIINWHTCSATDVIVSCDCLHDVDDIITVIIIYTIQSKIRCLVCHRPPRQQFGIGCEFRKSLA